MEIGSNDNRKCEPPEPAKRGREGTVTTNFKSEIKRRKVKSNQGKKCLSEAEKAKLRPSLDITIGGEDDDRVKMIECTGC